MTRNTNCIDCHCNLENVHNAKKRCDKCTERFRAQDQIRRDRKRYLRKIVGAFTEIDNRPCLVCKTPTIEKKNNRNKYKRRFCGQECESVFYRIDEKERYRWTQDPFTFRLSSGASARRLGSKYEIETSSCCFCGSVKALGEVAKRKLLKGGRVFCDEQCASEWKSIHYASANHKPMELQRQETRAKQQQRQEQSRKRKEELEIARLIKPANAKTPGCYTCTVCNKTEWVESHANRKFCSRKCNAKSPKAKATKKLSKQNRRHKTRSKSGVAQSICIDQLMKRDRRRCKKCNTLCVKPEGYNHPNEGTIDHIMPLSKGGLHLWNNVQLLCRQCNTAKRDVVLPGTQMMLRFAP
jgi:hypothetical protein